MESQTSHESTAYGNTVLGDGQHKAMSPMRTETRTNSLANIIQINPEIQQQCKYTLSVLYYVMPMHKVFMQPLSYAWFSLLLTLIPIGILIWQTSFEIQHALVKSVRE